MIKQKIVDCQSSETAFDDTQIKIRAKYTYKIIVVIYSFILNTVIL